MLQQTRAEVVIPYFLRWMALFPDLQSLAQASEARVMKAWEGLGYYSRTRRLHQGARFILDRWGAVPREEKDLLSIPGIGPYTAAAIRSFAFQERGVAVDGNVARVVARCLGWKEQSRAEIHKRAYSYIDEHLPRDASQHPWELVEASIELGACICKPKGALCEQCPLREVCVAFRTQQVENILPPKKNQIQPVDRFVPLLVSQGGEQEHVLLFHHPPWSLMGGLYEFPSIPLAERSQWEKLASTRGVYPVSEVSFAPITHCYTRFRATLHAALFTVEQTRPVPPSISLGEVLFNSSGEDKPRKRLASRPSLAWHRRSQLADYSFSSGHRKILFLLRSKIWTGMRFKASHAVSK